MLHCTHIVVPAIIGSLIKVALIPILQNRGSGTITTRQTTFWNLAFDDGRRARLHFLDKVEFVFDTERFKAFQVLDHHPLLADYSAGWVQLSFTGQPHQPEAVAAMIDATVRAASDGWRTASRYLNPFLPVTTLLRSGRGIIWDGPESYGTKVAAVLQGSGVLIQQFPGKRAPIASRVAMLDRSYVIARDFRLEVRDDDSGSQY